MCLKKIILFKKKFVYDLTKDFKIFNNCNNL